VISRLWLPARDRDLNGRSGACPRFARRGPGGDSGGRLSWAWRRRGASSSSTTLSAAIARRGGSRSQLAEHEYVLVCHDMGVLAASACPAGLEGLPEGGPHQDLVVTDGREQADHALPVEESRVLAECESPNPARIYSFWTTTRCEVLTSAVIAGCELGHQARNHPPAAVAVTRVPSRSTIATLRTRVPTRPEIWVRSGTTASDLLPSRLEPDAADEVTTS
jgi:hypothetical protein